MPPEYERLFRCRSAAPLFSGLLNPELQDRTPIRLLQEEDVEKVGPELLNAMRAFLAGG